MDKLQLFQIKNACDAYHYMLKNFSVDFNFNDKVKKIILSDPQYSYLYAKNILIGRWKEAENTNFFNDIHYLLLYTQDVIKGRWPKAEKVLLNSFYAIIYLRNTRNVFKKRSRKSEPILKDHVNISIYLKRNVRFNHE